MQFLIMVLNKVDKLDAFLGKLMEHNISGATILSSTGMVHELAKHSEDYPIFGALRQLVNMDREESKTIFMVLKDEKIGKVKEIARDVIGDLSKPDTAIIFTLPVLSIEGVQL